MRNYKNLEIWQKSLEFSIEVYNKTQSFPLEERYGLTSQIRRAATSIPINISEGAGRDSLKDYVHFIQIAEGSACEVECELIIARRLQYLSQQDFDTMSQEIDLIKRKIAKYKFKLEEDIKRKP